MHELPRFEPRVDSRPNDVTWAPAQWPVPTTTVLAGECVQLSVSTPDDAAELFESLDFAEVWEHVAGRPHSATEMSTLIESKLDNPTWTPWTVRLTKSYRGLPAGAIVGTTSFLETGPNEARTEIGSTTYTPAVWASSVNAECKLLLLTYAFEVLGMGRVQLKTDIRNVRSQQAIARLGATFEGVLRRYQRREDDTIRDTVLFSITSEEWPNVKARLEARLAAE